MASVGRPVRDIGEGGWWDRRGPVVCLYGTPPGRRIADRGRPATVARNLVPTDTRRMSPATDLAALFIRFAAEERDVAWLADEFLLVARKAKRVHVTRDPDRAASGLYCRVDAPTGCGEAVVPDQRAFRPLLARLAKVYATERGTDLLPYGGRLTFDRHTADGPVQIDVVFANTMDAQYLTLTTKAQG